MRSIFGLKTKEETSAPPPMDGQRMEVLIVESDERFLRRLTSMMRTAKLPDNATYLDISTANTLRDAIDKMEMDRFDIILTDVNLSDASGFLVLEELIEFGNRTPIVVLSNITNWSMIIQSAQAGVSDFLLKKALDPDLLMRSIFYAIERNRLESKATKAEEVYRSLVDILPVGLCRMDADGTFTFVNSIFANMHNRTADSILGKTFIDILDQETASKMKKAFDKVVQHDKNLEMEIHSEAPGQEVKALLFVATPIRDQRNGVEGVQLVLLDVTTQKQMQAEKDASNTLGALQSGLSNLANELNNAMAPILLDAENLRGLPAEQIPDDTLQRIESSVHKARSVLRPFLVSSQRVGPRSEELDARKIIVHALEEFREDLPSRIRLEMVVPEQLDALVGDASLLDKLFSNVLLNAQESMTESGVVKVVVRQQNLSDNEEMLASLDLKPDTYLHMQISDQGCGIAPHLRQRVFEPFYTTKDKPHTGVGLTETLGIIKSHHGSIKLESRVDEGTLVHLYLPVRSQKTKRPVEKNMQQTAGQAPGGKKVILLVDDEENILRSAHLLLKHFGYEVITATNGAEALTKFNERKSEVNLVISDVHMPVMDGPTLVKTLHEMAPSLKILLCTGLEVEGSMDEIGALPIDGTLFKPFTAKTLKETLTEHLGT